MIEAQLVPAPLIGQTVEDLVTQKAVTGLGGE